MRLRQIWIAAGFLALIGVVGARRTAAQPDSVALRRPGEIAPSLIPETTTMAVLATSLVGLCLLGLQKRRKG